LAGFEVTLYGRFWVIPKGVQLFQNCIVPEAEAHNVLREPFLKQSVGSEALKVVHFSYSFVYG
jgi:hypothetical protein